MANLSRRLQPTIWRPSSFLLVLSLLLFSSSSAHRPFLSSGLLLAIPIFFSSSFAETLDGPASYARGQELFQRGDFDTAAMELWKAVLLHGNTPPERQYSVPDVFQLFMQCYSVQGKTADGFAFVASESFRRGQIDMGKSYLEQAFAVDANNAAAKAARSEFRSYLGDAFNSDEESISKIKDNEDFNADLKGKTPEELYEIGSSHFSEKNFEECADVFEISCLRSGQQLGPSCVNAVYCRMMLSDYGFNGTQFEKDIARIEDFTRREASLYRLDYSGMATKEPFAWRRATSVHPHMMLGYPVDPMLKRYAAESCAFMDEPMARAANAVDNQLPPLPDGLPYEVDTYRETFKAEFRDPSAKIRIGFVGAGFNSKAVLFLSHDMFRFFDHERFEVHVFSFGPPDHELFIHHSMRGVDWRERVKANVDHFHDCQSMKGDHIEAAKYINSHQIHILIEWDGYARQGERAQGLFALRPAPLQMIHQEYIGTSGGLFVDYHFTDLVTTPIETQDLFVESLIYMPNHFFSKGHAYQAEVKQPTYDYIPKDGPYRPGTGTPAENRCLAPLNVGPSKPSFVFCNFNKILKSNPETLRSWIRILREVPDSMLCLMENPDVAIPYVRRFIHEAAGTSDGSDPSTFVPGDGDALNQRIHFLPWEKNPFDHQMRNQDFCNVMLDSHPYNGHTVAQDALYGGVPIVTRSDGKDMSSRVTTSGNFVLGIEDLNAYGGSVDYENIAIALGTNSSMYDGIRKKLIASALQRNPMHPYWDVARYVKNFETGLQTAWSNFLDGNPPRNIFVDETEEAKRGTYDEEILANPPQGKPKRERSRSNNDEL